ncbi:MAG: RluA family pseudouridine synthase [Blastocatellia bacterium]|nr:RluA family pseudouridine synthase [Blastocatellia bacterium]
MVQSEAQIDKKKEYVETLRLTNSITVKVLYEDRYLMAIDKPSGLLVAPAHWDKTGRNLMLMLREGLEKGVPWARRRHLRFIANIHRLDAETSGLLLLAKNRPVLAQMTKRFEERKVSKLYYALVDGVLAKDNFTVNEPIAEHPKHRGLMAVNRIQGRQSITNFQVVERFKKHTLLSVEPVTGRTHQIRVHLAHVGHPVVADTIYNRIGKFSEDDRLALHAARLEFKHPFLHTSVSVEAPIPKEFEKMLSLLRQ